MIATQIPRRFFAALLVGGAAGRELQAATSSAMERDVGWGKYLGGHSRASFSPRTQFSTRNVRQLDRAWEFRSGDAGQTQCNPIVIDGILYGATATNQMFALAAATGAELWRFKVPGHEFGSNQRGVTYWADGDDRRVLFNVDSWLYAVDARTGKSIPGFSEDGRVSSKAGLGERERTNGWFAPRLALYSKI